MEVGAEEEHIRMRTVDKPMVDMRKAGRQLVAQLVCSTLARSRSHSWPCSWTPSRRLESGLRVPLIWPGEGKGRCDVGR